MRLTLKLREDILALLDIVKTKQAEKGAPWSDSLASKLCFGHGEYVGNLRKWNGGPKGPTLEKTAQFETFLSDQMDRKEYEAFLKSRGRQAPPASYETETASKLDDWD